ncbi:MAG: GntR family transcriptional regulator [Anaerolineae bacterium]|nr:GntR family transcriptional regulator [Anaerolineae bacterium]
MNTSASPVYLQIIESILQSIRDGVYQPGQQLPTQRELCEQYHISLMTMRKVLDELHRMQVIHSIPGKGTYVSPRRQETDYGTLIGFEEQMARLGLKPRTQTLEIKRMPAPTVIAEILRIQPGQMIVYVYRLRFADERPISLYKVYIPLYLAPDIIERGLAEKSLFKMLREEYGYKLVGSRNTVSAVVPDDEAKRLLDLTETTALLLREQVTFIETGEVIEYSVNLSRGDMYCTRYDEGQIF